MKSNFYVKDLSTLAERISALAMKISTNPKKFLSPEASVLGSIEPYPYLEYEQSCARLKAITKGEIIPTEYNVMIEEMKTSVRTTVFRPEYRESGGMSNCRALSCCGNDHDFNVLKLTEDGYIDEIMYHSSSTVRVMTGKAFFGTAYELELPSIKDYDDVDAWLFQYSTVKNLSAEKLEIMKFFMTLQKYKEGRKRLPKFSISFEHINLEKLEELYNA